MNRDYLEVVWFGFFLTKSPEFEQLICTGAVMKMLFLCLADILRIVYIFEGIYKKLYRLKDL